MTKKICMTVIIMAAIISTALANQIDESSRIISAIRNSVNACDSGFCKLRNAYDRINEYDIAHASAIFRDISIQCERIGDERMLYCAALFSSVYYIDHYTFGEAIESLSAAEKYAHEQEQINYINYLKSLCYIKTKKTKLIAHSLDNIVNNRTQGSSFANVIYCEALRAMSIYCEANGSMQSAFNYMNTHCKMADTITCNSVPAEYYIIPKFLKSKYIEKKATDIHSYEASQDQQSMPAKAIAAVMTAIAALSAAYSIRLRRARASAQPETRDEIDLMQSSLAFAPIATIVGKTTNAVTIVNADGTIRWVNAGFEKLFGYTINEFILTYGNNIFASSKIEDRRKAFAKCSAELKSQQYTTKISSGYGTQIWIQGTISPIVENGLVSQYIVIETDITKIKNENQTAKDEASLIYGNMRNASDIQKALMPTKIEISKVFENFVIYKPKDYVSGDFYWFNKLGDSYYFALGDCTGHGVSGSLLCVLSMKTLDEIILGSNITDPKEILERMDEAICKSLKQDCNKNKDGLDITICRITPTPGGASITLAGAKSYFFYHTNGSTTMIRGSKHSIGGIVEGVCQYTFENVDLQLNKGDMIYFASDGLIDQNNPQRKSLGRQRFLNIIDQASRLDILEQEEYITTQASEWQQGEPQRDDICVAGIRI